MSERGSRLGSRERVRAQSNVVATVLLAALVVSGASVVIYAGSAAIDQGFSGASLSATEESMLSLDEQVQRLVSGDTSEASVEVAGSPENLAMHTDTTTEAGVVTITAGGTTRSYTLGTVRYDKGGQVVAYQGGGVWRKSAGEDGAVTVSPPPVGYRTVGTESTLSFPVVQLDGEASGTQLRVESVDRESLLSDLGIDRRPAAGTSIEVEIESEFYRAWADYLRQEVGEGPVSTLPAQQKVVVRFESTFSPAGGSIGGAAFSDGATSTLRNAIITDSYTSPGYPSGTSMEGDVRTMAEFNLKNSPTLEGEIHAMRGSSELTTSGGTVYGQVRLGCCAGAEGPGDSPEPTKMENGQDYMSTFSNKNDFFIKKSTGGNFHGDVIVGGTSTHGNDYSLKLNGKPTFHQDLHVHGNLQMRKSQKPVIEGDVYVEDGDMDVDSEGEVEGSVYVKNGDVEFLSASRKFTIEGDLVVEGSVDLNDKVTVDGMVIANDIDTNGGTINGGTASDPSNHLPSGTNAFEDPLEPQVPERNPVDSRIASKGSSYSNPANNNHGGPGVVGVSGPGVGTLATSCDPNCVLTEGNYYLERIDLTNTDNDKLVLRPDGGEINVYVDDYVRVDNAPVVVEGDGRVNVWVGDDTSSEELQITNNPVIKTVDSSGTRTYRAPALWFYLKKDAEVKMTGGSTQFTGVIYGPGSQQMSGGMRVIDDPGAAITIQNGLDLYGAVVGQVETIDNSAAIHYDTALGGETSVPGGGTGSGTAAVDFITITRRTATVDD